MHLLYSKFEVCANNINTQNENLKIKILRVTQALVKCVMKTKERRRINDCCIKVILLKGGLYKATVSEGWLGRFR